MKTDDQTPQPTAEKPPENGALNNRHSMTMAERQIIALERISDQLALLAREMLNSPDLQSLEGATAVAGTPQTSSEEAESENASVPDASPDIPDGIIRKRVDCYLVGSYRYTDLDSAIAELRRRTTESKS